MYKIIAFFIIILGYVNFNFGQNLSNNPDQLFSKAKQLAFNNKYQSARDIARLVLQINEKYHDARILIGRTYAWEHKYDSARYEINKVLQLDSINKDAIDAFVDLETWSNNYISGIAFCDLGLKFYPGDKNFLLKKAKLLLLLNKEEEARAVLALLLNSNQNSYEVNTMLNSLKKFHNQFNIEHTFDFFKTPYVWRWHLTSLQYQMNNKTGVFLCKLNFGQLVADGDHYLSSPNVQLEVEAYPIINPTTYIYADYAYSWFSFFPMHRFGLEPFKTINNNIEISAGLRLLIFNQAPGFSYIPILTGSFSKYYGNNWISFRPYITFSPNHETSWASYLFYRYYLSSKNNYIGIMAGYGISPDDRNNSGIIEHFNSDSYHLRFDIQHHITNRILFRFMSEFIFESYLPNLYHNRFVNNLFLSYYF